MDVRKKLVEIVKQAAYSSLPSNTEDFHLNMFVTNLLSHGVTVQEWISVDDRLPEPEQSVILYTREIETYGKYYEKKKIYRNIYMGYFDGDEWLTSYCHGCEYIFRMNEKYPNETIEVTHWMPMTPPPKGE